MTQRAQELFLAYAHFCGERGVEPLIPIIKQAVIDAVSNLQLSTKLDADQVLQVLSDVHRREPSCFLFCSLVCMVVNIIVCIVSYNICMANQGHHPELLSMFQYGLLPAFCQNCMCCPSDCASLTIHPGLWKTLLHVYLPDTNTDNLSLT